jgi:hypothetical protein
MEEQLRKDEILFLPIIGTDRFLVIRKDRKGKPLYVSYQDLLNQLLAIISQNVGSGLLLQTNNTTNPVQNVLNLLQGSGVTIVDNGDGSVTINASGGGSPYTADNGLTENPTNNFQLGGATLGTGNLIRDTYITNDGFIFRIDQTTGNALFLNTTTGTGLTSIVGTGIAVRSRSDSGVALEGLSFDDYSLLLIRETAGTNDVIGLIKGQRNTTGAAAAGLGGALELWIEHRNTIPSPSPTVPTATFEAIWLNPGPLVANRVGKFRIRLDLADVQQDILSGIATGQITLEKYGLGTFTGTAAYMLAVNSIGEIIESPIPPPVIKSISSGANITGDLNINVSKTLLIPANYFPSNSMVRITQSCYSNTAFSTATARIYINDTPDLAGTPVLIGTVIMSGNANTNSFITRHLAIENNASLQRVNNPAQNVFLDQNAAMTRSLLSIDFTTVKYYVATVQLGNISKTASMDDVTIEVL